MPKTYVDPVKSKYRQRLRTFVERHLRQQLKKDKSRKQIKVACLPGAENDGEEGIEIYEIWDRLGIPRANILGFEKDPVRWKRLKKANLGIELTKSPEYDYDFFAANPERTFDVIHLDYTCYFNHSAAYSIDLIAGEHLLGRKGILATNFLAGRENDETQEFIKLNQRFMTETFQELPRIVSTPCLREKVLANGARMAGYGLDGTSPLSEHRSDVIQWWLFCAMQKGSANINFDYLRPIYKVDEWLASRVALISADPNTLSERDRGARAELESVYEDFGRTIEEKICRQSEIRVWGIKRMEEILSKEGASSGVLSVYMHVYMRPYLVEDNASLQYVSGSHSKMYADFLFLDVHEKDTELMRRLFEEKSGKVVGMNRNCATADQWQVRYTLETLIKKYPWLSGVYKRREDLTRATTANHGPVKLSPEQKRDIHNDIVQGRNDEEILREYRITPRQLGAFRAHAGVPRQHANGKIKPDDKAAMWGLLASGMSTSELHEQFSQYGIWQIRGVKAEYTRKQR